MKNRWLEELRIGSKGCLGLCAGEIVEVRSKDEILSTLDDKGCVDGMPFMPEMLEYCGRQLRVSKRAEKACDTIKTGNGRRIRNAVHLENLRCGGEAHGGCQASCLFWWKEDWLKRPGGHSLNASPLLTEQALNSLTCRTDPIDDEPIYSCQVTQLLEFSEHQDWEEPFQYIRELRCGNIGFFEWIRVMTREVINVLRSRRGRDRKPTLRGMCEGKTPKGEPLGLKAGDWVSVKTKEEIEQTIDDKKLNRGLSFDVEMLPYCGKRIRLLKKVDKIIDEESGKMQQLPNDCWILDGAVCGGKYSAGRLLCTRAIYSYWREIWLRKVSEPVDAEIVAADLSR